MNVEMEEGNDQFLDSFDMMFFMVDSTSPNALLEAIEPLQSPNGSSSPPPFLNVSSFDSGELVSSARIPNVPCSNLLSQTLECEDGYGTPNPTFKANIPEEDISFQGKNRDVSPLIFRDLEEDYENATKGNFSYNSSHSQCKELHSMHNRMKRAASHTRDQAQRRIWGVSSNGKQKIGKIKLDNWRPKSSMEVELDWDDDSCVPKKKSTVVTPTSEAGSKRGAFSRIPSHSDLECTLLEHHYSDNSNGLGLKSKKKAMSRNLVSERQRRRKLNDKLYSLRALVPNISKMDKASVVADAISYVRELKRQVEELQTEVSHLKEALANGLPISKLQGHQHYHKVVKFTVTHMQDQIYHLQIHCNRTIGVWLQLIQAIEALGYDTISANFSSVSDHILNNLIIKVPKEKVLHKEELCHKAMDAMLRFGFVFDLQK